MSCSEQLFPFMHPARKKTQSLLGWLRVDFMWEVGLKSSDELYFAILYLDLLVPYLAKEEVAILWRCRKYLSHWVPMLAIIGHDHSTSIVHLLKLDFLQCPSSLILCKLRQEPTSSKPEITLRALQEAMMFVKGSPCLKKQSIFTQLFAETSLLNTR